LAPENLALEDLMTPTINSKLVRCNYFILVHFEHAGITLGTGTSLPDIVMNLCLYPPSTTHRSMATTAPEGWKPKRFDMTKLHLISHHTQGDEYANLVK